MDTKNKVLRIEQDVQITDPDTSSLVVLQPIVEKAAGFSTEDLRGYTVIECPAPVWAFCLGRSPFIIDSEVLTEIVVDGWALSVLNAQKKEIGWAQFNLMRDTYLCVSA